MMDWGCYMKKGIIYNIMKYSIHDGPGIRTTVFLKGCPLDCWWCHNPESQNSQIETMEFPERCIGCKECIKACKLGIMGKNISKENFKKICNLCGKCIDVCYALAREMIGKEMTTFEVMEEIKKDSIFYSESGGGATFSGGEPLMQKDFLEDLLRECKKNSIHTALDTSGYGPIRDLLDIAKLTDLFLYDIKLMDNGKHVKYTGVPNKLILDNLRELSKLHSNIIIRIPVIPGVNDDGENILATGELAVSLGIKEINLLPFHRAGTEKYKKLNMEHKLKDLNSPKEAAIEILKDKLVSMGLIIKIGG
jgi:pyruvate formate lyase activating enzyme